MSDIIERSFKILEELSSHPKGRTLSELATKMEVPLSATHRLLNDLIECGYVRKDERHGEFTLTHAGRLARPALSQRQRLVDVAQPALERLAASSGELVRLARRRRRPAHLRGQGAGRDAGPALRPRDGSPVTLACSAAGFAWLATKTDDEALRLVAKQGFGDPDDYGPAAPTHHQGA